MTLSASPRTTMSPCPSASSGQNVACTPPNASVTPGCRDRTASAIWYPRFAVGVMMLTPTTSAEHRSAMTAGCSSSEPERFSL